jgi:hypothetical protein
MDTVLETRIVIKSEERRLVYGEVYAPWQIDTDGETMSPEEIERMAHKFLSAGRTNKIDIQHDGIESGALVVESFMARKDDPDGFVVGSWVLGVIIPEGPWGAVKSGELNGFSFAGSVAKQKTKAKVKVTKRLVGKTEKSAKDGLLPAHQHSVDLSFDGSGSIIDGGTDVILGHSHGVGHTTATGAAMDHSHRLILIDN